MNDPYSVEFPIMAELRAFIPTYQEDVNDADEQVREWIHPIDGGAPLISEVIGWYAGIDLWALYDRARILRYLTEHPGVYDQIFKYGSEAEAAWTGKGGEAFFSYLKAGSTESKSLRDYVEAVKLRVDKHYDALAAADGNSGVIGTLKVAMTGFKDTINTNIKGFKQRREANLDAATSVFDPPQLVLDSILNVYKANIKDSEQIANSSDTVGQHVDNLSKGHLIDLDVSQLGAVGTGALTDSIAGGWKPE